MAVWSLQQTNWSSAVGREEGDCTEPATDFIAGANVITAAAVEVEDVVTDIHYLNCSMPWYY